MNPPPPIPLAMGFTTPRQNAVATDASTAFPPARKASRPMSEHRSSSAATIPSSASTMRSRVSPCCLDLHLNVPKPTPSGLSNCFLHRCRPVCNPAVVVGKAEVYRINNAAAIVTTRVDILVSHYLLKLTQLNPVGSSSTD